MTVTLRHLFAVLLLLPSLVAAEILELPVDQPLDGEAGARVIEIHLRHALVEIVVDPEASPRLRARRRSPEDPEANQVSQPAVEWADQDGAISLARADVGQPTIPIRVELVVNAVERLALRGTELDVTIREDVLREDVLREDVPEGEAPQRFNLRVERSNVDLEGVIGARVTLIGGRLHLVRTGGVFVISATEEAKVEIEDHDGELQLEGDEGEFRIFRHLGELTLDLEESRLVVTDSESHCHGQVRGGWIQLEGWRGTGQITGNGAVIELLRAGHPKTELTLEGRGLEVTVDQYEGTFTAVLRGGTLRGGNLVGRTDITGRSEAFVELAGLRGEVRLSLESGSSALMTDVAGKLVADVKDSRLETERVADLHLLAERAEVFVSELTRLGRAKAIDSRLELDLTGVNHDPSFILKGAATARVRLRTPCEVRLVEVGEIEEERAKVSGCEFRNRMQASETLPSRTRVEGAVKLIVSVSEESSLVVRGVSP